MERGKVRHIQSVHVSERTVQKLLCQHALHKTIYPSLIYDNSASQKGKGTEFAIRRLVEHLRWHLARYSKNGAIAVIDFKDFFNSIPHDKVIEAMQEGQNDPMICKYIADFVNAFDGTRGLGLGSETSQIGAILYPTPIDKLVKDELGIHCYARYMDDAYIIHPDRKYVEHCLDRIRDKCVELNLSLSECKTKIHNLASDDFVFLKKRVHITESNKIVLRLTRKNIHDEKQRIRERRKDYLEGRAPLKAVFQSYQSWREYAKSYDAYHVVGEMDRFFAETMSDIIAEDLDGMRVDFGRPKLGNAAEKRRQKVSH